MSRSSGRKPNPNPHPHPNQDPLIKPSIGRILHAIVHKLPSNPTPSLSPSPTPIARTRPRPRPLALPRTRTRTRARARTRALALNRSRRCVRARRSSASRPTRSTCTIAGLSPNLTPILSLCLPLDPRPSPNLPRPPLPLPLPPPHPAFGTSPNPGPTLPLTRCTSSRSCTSYTARWRRRSEAAEGPTSAYCEHTVRLL